MLSKNKNDAFNSKLTLFNWCFLVLVVPYIRSFDHPSTLTDRNTLFIVPALVIMVSRGLDTLRKIEFQYAVSASIVVMLLVNVFYTNGNYYKKITKQQWRDATRFVIKKDPDATYPIYAVPLYRYYFNQIYKLDRKINNVPVNAQDVENICEKVAKNEIPGAWILEAHKINKPELHEICDSWLYRANRYSGHGVRASLYLPVHSSTQVVHRSQWRGHTGIYLEIGGNDGRMNWPGSISAKVELKSGKVYFELDASSSGGMRKKRPRMIVKIYEPEAKIGKVLFDDRVGHREFNYIRFSTSVAQPGQHKVVLTFVDSPGSRLKQHIAVGNLLINQHAD
jgi:hypothetical protein